jgi:2-polyprenyl-3-methyl-5-hydroxy-6-metoxy-1,4-benzoquinol methylase
MTKIAGSGSISHPDPDPHQNVMDPHYWLRQINKLFFLGKFDFIECRHVLEHVVDPMKGLQSLASLLKEDGAISLSLHAE